MSFACFPLIFYRIHSIPYPPLRAEASGASQGGHTRVKELTIWDIYAYIL